jgi:FkbM family methyltransferase
MWPWTRRQRLSAQALTGGLPGSLRFDELANQLFTAASATFSPVRFVQVGAHDGASGDPINAFIRTYAWEGVAIEPVPMLFDRLCGTYRDRPGVTCLNVCVGPVVGRRTFYTMKPIEAAPVDWYTQLSSLRKDVILKHEAFIPGIADLIEEIEVETMTLVQIIDASGWVPDVLVIDTEGYDGQILSSLDLHRHKPGIIYYEVRHLEAEETARTADRLRQAGYAVLADEANAVAVDRAIIPRGALASLSARLAPGISRLL